MASALNPCGGRCRKPMTVNPFLAAENGVAPSVCVVCLDSDDVCGCCEDLRLPGSGTTVRSKVSQWEVRRRPTRVKQNPSWNAVSAGTPGSQSDWNGGSLPLCRSCLALVSEMDELEAELDALFDKFWTRVAGGREVKLEVMEPVVDISSPPVGYPFVEELASTRLGDAENHMDCSEGMKIDVSVVKKEAGSSSEVELRPPGSHEPEANPHSSGNAGGCSSLSRVVTELTISPATRVVEGSGEHPERTKRKVPPSVCDACGATFKWTHNLRRHQKERCEVLHPIIPGFIHGKRSPGEADGSCALSLTVVVTGEPAPTSSYSCEACQRNFWNNATLKRHRQTCKAFPGRSPVKGAASGVRKVGGSRETFPCDTCGAVYKWVHCLRRHLRKGRCKISASVAAPEVEDETEECSDLVVGNVVRTSAEADDDECDVEKGNSTRFVCEECERPFRDGYSLKRHVRSCGKPRSLSALKRRRKNQSDVNEEGLESRSDVASL